MADADDKTIVQKFEEKGGKELDSDELLILARLSETAERYEDMCQVMKKLVERKSSANQSLNVEARNMLSVAYKNVVGSRRQAWRSLESEKNQNEEELKAFKAMIEKELNDYCGEILDILQDCLIDENAKKYWSDLFKLAEGKDKAKELAFADPAKAKEKKATLRDNFIFETWKKDVLDTGKSVYNSSITADDVGQLSGELDWQISEKHGTDIKQAVKDTCNDVETLVFYMKMCGDYKRYLAEIIEDADAKSAAAQESAGFYEVALNCAQARLAPTHPTRLGLSLNMSVCYYEILGNSQEACRLAKEAFDAAIQKLDSLANDTYKDSTLIMQLIRDNLTIWTGDNNNNPEDNDA